MVIIWKGFGLIVPIALVGIGYLTSLFYDDKRLGNTDLLGWTFLWSSIIFLIVGIGFSSVGEDEKEVKHKPLWQHTFFFIPILFWGIILLAFSVYFLLIYNPNKVDSPLNSGDLAPYEQIEVEGTTVHFYNPTGDTMIYYFSDQYENNNKVKLAGYETDYQVGSGQEDQANLIGAMTLDGVTKLMIVPEDQKKYDKNKFIVVKENGKDVLLRKIELPTKETNDYDDVWVLLDKEFSLALIDVTSLYKNGKINSEVIKQTNWNAKIVEKHSGNDIIKLNVSHPNKNGTLKVIEPNTVFPEEIDGSTKVYFLAEYLDENDLTNDYLIGEIIRLATDEE